MRTIALLCLASTALGACNTQTTNDDTTSVADTTTPQPTATVTETAIPEPARTSDPQVEAAGAEDEAEARRGALQDTIPARFHGDWSEDLDHCDTPGHQRYDIRSDQIGFFESRGIVRNVNVNGNYAAATVSEQYGDAPPAEYVFYMAIEGPDTMRIRYDDNPRFRIYRCP